MTLDEISKYYNVDIKKLKFFEKNKLITITNVEFKDKDLKKLSILCTLYDSGLDADNIKRFIKLDYSNEKSEQIKLLNLYRNNLLDSIHKKQKSLDNLDYIIYKIKNKNQQIF
ncbi:MAG: MerR family transcriptional regulator [Clostridia bacterium]|nr:MerR family transcriptional regulator [Clostridia bacterium]